MSETVESRGTSTSNDKLLVKAVENLMETVMSRYDPSHDALHVKRVRETALKLARTMDPSPDLLVVEIAALMHDMADKKYVKLPEGMSLATYFPMVFKGLDLPEGVNAVNVLGTERIEAISRIIENVSWTTEKRLRKDGLLEPWHSECRELHCVQDADRLDAIGAIGVMRCCAYSAAVNRPLVVIPGQEPNGYEKGGSAYEHFDDKLLHIKDRLKTDAGKELGEKRHAFMLSFLAQLRDETNVD